MLLDWGIWRQNSLFFFSPLIKMGVIHTAVISGWGNLFPHVLHKNNGACRAFCLQRKRGVFWKTQHCPPESADSWKHQLGVSNSPGRCPTCRVLNDKYSCVAKAELRGLERLSCSFLDVKCIKLSLMCWGGPDWMPQGELQPLLRRDQGMCRK